VWEVVRTVAAPPSIVNKCLWEVFVWGVVLVVCVCVSVSGVLFSVGVRMRVRVTCCFFYTLFVLLHSQVRGEASRDRRRDCAQEARSRWEGEKYHYYYY